mgnify:CR=1 FL=1
MMTIPVAVLPKTLKRDPVEAVIPEAVIPETGPVEVNQEVTVPVAVHLEVVQAAVVQAAAPEAEVNLAEVALVEAVPEAEVNLVEAAPAAENLPVVKVQNNV